MISYSYYSRPVVWVYNVLLKEVYVYVKFHVSVVYPLRGKAEERLDHTYMGFNTFRLLPHSDLYTYMHVHVHKSNLNGLSNHKLYS